MEEGKNKNEEVKEMKQSDRLIIADKKTIDLLTPILQQQADIFETIVMIPVEQVYECRYDWCSVPGGARL